MLKIDSGASESLVEPSERFMPKLLDDKQGQGRLSEGGSVRTFSTDRQSKNYRPWFLVVKETME